MIEKILIEKTAKVVPVFKKYSKLDYSNYSIVFNYSIFDNKETGQ